MNLKSIEYSKKSKIVICVLGVIVILFFITINYFTNKINADTILYGEKLQVVIFNVSCSNGKVRNSLWFRNNKNEVKHVNVDYYKCQNYKIGDTINIVFNQKLDWYLIKPN